MATASTMTWQEAKAQAQALELEIASLIPAEHVMQVDQMPTGTLLSCDQDEWNWHGATTITVVEGTDIDAVVKSIQSHFADSRFDISTRYNFAEQHVLHLASPETAESYIIAEGLEEDQIRIASGSVCFTLPDDVWPGGEF